jgi:2'-5' RNA ligase
MPRLVVVLPLVPMAAGVRFAFRDWPLHLTVVPVFETAASVEDIAARLATFAGRRVTVTVGPDEGFGRSGGITAAVIEPSIELTALHGSLSAALAPLDFENPEYTGVGYRGHITVKPHGRVYPGDVLTLTQLALVDMTPGNQREVLAVADLTAAR